MRFNRSFYGKIDGGLPYRCTKLKNNDMKGNPGLLALKGCIIFL
jgi:hypothetical protein